MILLQIIKAYDEIDLKPCQDEFYIKTVDGDLCCPLTALALAEKVVLVHPRMDKDVHSWAIERYGLNKVLGFQDGWDWRNPGKDAPVYDQDYRDGFELGKIAVKTLIME